MLELGFIEQDEYESAVKQELVLKSSDETEDTAYEAYSWYVDALIVDVIADLMEAKTSPTIWLNCFFIRQATP